MQELKLQKVENGYKATGRDALTVKMRTGLELDKAGAIVLGREHLDVLEKLGYKLTIAKEEKPAKATEKPAKAAKAAKKTTAKKTAKAAKVEKVAAKPAKATKTQKPVQVAKVEKQEEIPAVILEIKDFCQQNNVKAQIIGRYLWLDPLNIAKRPELEDFEIELDSRWPNVEKHICNDKQYPDKYGKTMIYERGKGVKAWYAEENKSHGTFEAIKGRYKVA